MDEEVIIKAIDKLCKNLKGTKYESDALKTKRKIEKVLEDAATQQKADGALEDYISSIEGD